MTNAESNNVTRVLSGKDARLNVTIRERANLGREDVIDLLRALEKMEHAGKRYIGHIVTAKDHELLKFLTERELATLVGLQEGLGIPRGMRAMGWSPPSGPSHGLGF